MPTIDFRTSRLLMVLASVELYWGLSAYAFPDQFRAPVYALLLPYLPYLSALCMAGGVTLLLMRRYALKRWVRLLLYAVPIAPLLWLTLYALQVNSWAGLSIYGSLCTGLLAAAASEALGAHGTTGPDLHVGAVGVLNGALGLLMLSRPDFFGSASFTWIRPALPWAGAMGLVGAAALFLPMRGLPRLRQVLGAVLPGVMAYNYLQTKVFTGPAWGLLAVGLLVNERWLEIPVTRPAALSLDQPTAETLSRILEAWTWVMSVIVVAVSALFGTRETEYQLLTHLFVLVCCAINLLALAVRRYVTAEQHAAGHMVLLAIGIGILLVGQGSMAGTATAVLLMAIPPVATWALGARAGHRMLVVVMAVILLSGLNPLVAGAPASQALGRVTLISAVIGLGAWLAMRVANQQRRLLQELRGARADLQRQIRQLRLVDQVGGAIRQSLDLRSMLQATVDELGQVMGTSRCHVWTIDERGNCTCAAEHVAQGIAPVGVSLVVPISSTTLATYAHGIVVVSDVEKDERLDGEGEGFRSSLRGMGVRSFLGATVRVNGELVAAITFHECVQQRNWSAEETGFLNAVAAQLGLAIAHAEAHQDLERLSHQNDLILQSAGEGICGVDLTGRISFANPVARRILGVDDLVGRSIYEMIRASDEPAEDPIARALTEGATSHVLDARFGPSDERAIPVEYLSTPIRESGAVVGAVVTFQDITERRAVQRLKDEFVSVVSHELRTPLTSIRGSLGLLARGHLGVMPEKGQRMLDIAVQNTERLVRLINDILDIERIESGRVTIEQKRCRADDLVTASVELIGAMAEKANVTIHVEAQPIPLIADPDRIIQTLTNLLSNAVKFSPEGSSVWISTEQRKDELIFQVRDQGRGIPADKLEIIFERFQQVDASDSRSKGGTGLGLAICRSIVQQHGGRIWAESALENGSTFFVSLPAASSDSAVARVLVAENDEDLAQVLVTMFERMGVEVLRARNGWEALSLIRTKAPDLVVLEVIMAGLDGFGVVQGMRDQALEIPLVVYTAKDLNDLERSRLRLGETYFLTKGRAPLRHFEERVRPLIGRVMAQRA